MAIATAGLLASACADAAPSGEGSVAVEPTPSPPPTGPSINWDFPYGETAPTFDSVSEAASQLAFEFDRPSFAQPDVVQLTPPELTKTPEEQGVAMIFNLPVEGAILLEVRLAGDFDLEAMKGIVSAHEGEPADVAPGDSVATFIPAYQLVPLRGTDVLFVQGLGLGRVTWVEKGVRYDLMGETATGAQVLALAAAL